MSIDLDNSAAAAATKLRLPSLPHEMWAQIFSKWTYPQIINFVNHNKHKASGKKEVSVHNTDRALVLKEILHGMKFVLNGHAFSQVQLSKLYKEVFDTELEPALGRSFVKLVSEYRQDSTFLAISMSNPALLCSSDYMSNILGINVTDWLRKDPNLFLDLVRNKLVKATAVHNTPELNIPGLAELQELQHSIDLDLIHAAGQEGIEPAVRQIKKGADVNKTSTEGNTVLMTAAYYNRLQVVEYLIKQCGADVEKQNSFGKTALMYAASFNKLQVVEYLIKQCGADAEKQDKNGKTALMNAAQYGQFDIARCLVECGANVEKQNSFGKTALMYAAYYDMQYGNMHDNLNKKLKVVKDLIEKGGADVEKQDKCGKTALIHAAHSNNSLEAVKYLVECGANPREAKVRIEKKFGEAAFAELESIFFDVTIVEEFLNEVLGPIVQKAAIAGVIAALSDMHSSLAGVGPDLFASEQDFV
jgi:ankyrin repeat protein